MNTEPTKEPSPWLLALVAVCTAFGLWQLLFPGQEAPSATLFWMRAIFSGMGVGFLVVTALRRFRWQRRVRFSMSSSRATPPPLLPPSRAACWREFAKWTLGIPLVVGLGLGFVWLVLSLNGGNPMTSQADSSMGTALFWLAAIALMYPALMIMWVADLRAGLRAARDWDTLSDAEQTAAIAAGATAIPARRRRKKG